MGKPFQRRFAGLVPSYYKDVATSRHLAVGSRYSGASFLGVPVESPLTRAPDPLSGANPRSDHLRRNSPRRFCKLPIRFDDEP